MPHMRTIYHGVNLSRLQIPAEEERDYFSFLGRIAPLKGTHLAVEIAKRTGIPLKIAGEIQPCFRDYFETKVKPHIDGKFIEYVGRGRLGDEKRVAGEFEGDVIPNPMERTVRTGDD